MPLRAWTHPMEFSWELHQLIKLRERELEQYSFIKRIVTFARNGYTFSGTLLNNTDISGSIESMNVWYKKNG